MKEELNKNMVTYGEYYITKSMEYWDVSKEGKDKSVLFSGTYDECFEYCKSKKN